MSEHEKIKEAWRERWLGKLLQNYQKLTFLSAFILSFIYFYCNTNTDSNYYNNFVIDKCQIFSGNTNPLEIKSDSILAKDSTLAKFKAVIDSRIENRKDHYENTNISLSSSINGLAICCLLGIVLLYFDKKDEIHIAGISIPFKSVFLILPSVMIYLWLSFGFSFFSSIDSRIVCYISMVKAEAIENKLIENSKDTPNYFSRDYSRIHSLEDGGVIDAVSNVFLGFYTETVYNYFYNSNELLDKSNSINNNHVFIKKDFTGSEKSAYYQVLVSLFLVFGTLLGLAIGLITALVVRFQKVYSENSDRAVWLSISSFFLIQISIIGFVSQKPYLAPFCAYVWFVSGVVLWLYSDKLKKKRISSK